MQTDESLLLDFKSTLRSAQTTDEVDLTGAELLHILSLFDPYGAWRLEVDTGQVFWTEDVFKIHGMEPVGGAVDLNAAVAVYHPEDRSIVTRLLEDTIDDQSGSRFVLRLRRPSGSYKLVKSTGMFRINKENRPEVVGTFSEFQPAKRAVGAVA